MYESMINLSYKWQSKAFDVVNNVNLCAWLWQPTADLAMNS